MSIAASALLASAQTRLDASYFTSRDQLEMSRLLVRIASAPWTADHLDLVRGLLTSACEMEGAWRGDAPGARRGDLLLEPHYILHHRFPDNEAIALAYAECLYTLGRVYDALDVLNHPCLTTSVSAKLLRLSVLTSLGDPEEGRAPIIRMLFELNDMQQRRLLLDELILHLQCSKDALPAPPVLVQIAEWALDAFEDADAQDSFPLLSLGLRLVESDILDCAVQLLLLYLHCQPAAERPSTLMKISDLAGPVVCQQLCMSMNLTVLLETSSSPLVPGAEAEAEAHAAAATGDAMPLHPHSAILAAAAAAATVFPSSSASESSVDCSRDDADGAGGDHVVCR